MVVIEDGTVELERCIGAEREIGAVGHHQPRGAVDAGAHGLVAQHAVTDIDLASVVATLTTSFLTTAASPIAGLRMRARNRGAGGNNKRKSETNATTPLYIYEQIDAPYRNRSSAQTLWYIYH